MADMDLSKLNQIKHQVPRGYTYNYYTSPAKASKPTIILFHGWPDTAALFAGFINNHLLPAGYGIIAVDCLGYGGTSKPTSMHEYAWNHMTADIVSILDKENHSTVISLGHDWGCAIAQRLYNYHPARVLGLVLLNVAYVPATGDPLDLDAVNAATKEAFGHKGGIYEYWHLFTADDGTAVENANLESLYTAAFGDPKSWLDIWTTPNGMRAWLEAGKTQEVLPFADANHKADFMERLSKDGGLEAPNCWYKAYASNVQSQADAKLPKENVTINVPVYYWGGEEDYVCRPQLIQGPIDAGYLPDVKCQTRPGGHWALLQGPEVFGKDVVGWLEERFA